MREVGRFCGYLANSYESLVQVQGSNIRHYYNYILSRAKSFRDTKLDWVRDGQGRLKKQNVDKGLLRETESVQKQISALLQCEVCVHSIGGINMLFADFKK